MKTNISKHDLIKVYLIDPGDKTSGFISYDFIELPTLKISNLKCEDKMNNKSILDDLENNSFIYYDKICIIEVPKYSSYKQVLDTAYFCGRIHQLCISSGIKFYSYTRDQITKMFDVNKRKRVKETKDKQIYDKLKVMPECNQFSILFYNLKKNSKHWPNALALLMYHNQLNK